MPSFVLLNQNTTIIKNLFGKKLFIYSIILYCGNYTIDSTFILYISKNEVGFHGIVFGKRIQISK